MSTLLLLIVILKGICIYFCWRSISLAKKNTIKNPETKTSNELQDLENRLAKLVDQNENLSKELQGIKKQSS
ncbi:DUF5320 domain-containing protein [Anaerobacillus isosaccharinicus]|uniref:DUF5320 domain-containing protein n=1 Tax=Anaerobacillus isosaccharinicus TaxID=1532552 RepID=A0A1S2L485_9BACI|nr:DUF5320 domain-containing protein [Anaerobacillus isosaccharinicus]MBA5584756.1 DUF5320 domain-containing protein [Anaerobacillus isosaccharinicus]QOY36876.1 DUF5320 domain-containing protein [Anaerobacillus isosaccharinicus]